MTKTAISFFKQNWKVITPYILLLTIYAWFSFGLVAPNLTLINQAWFIGFQQQMWQLIFNNRVLATTIFISIISLLFLNYLLLGFYITKQVKDDGTKLSWQTKIFLLIIVTLPLLLSYNALSYDIFNYMFNAKMVVVYQANPHIQTALDFSDDPWTRFMHNVHTPAPYGYSWTALSLLPFIMGFNKFLTTWLSFRLWSVASLIITVLLMAWLKNMVYQQKLTLADLVITYFNPLILIEVVSNNHNDLWMMVFALLSLALLLKIKLINKSLLNRFLLVLGSIFLFAFSVSIKLASMALIPIWILLFLENACVLNKQVNRILRQIGLIKLKNWLYQHWPFVASGLMFLPLFTIRSQQFHPWYLAWSFVWLPLIKISWWKQLLIAFSWTGLLRYVPWLRKNQYNQLILLQQKIITWSAPIWLLITTLLNNIFKGDNTKTTATDP